MDEERIKKLITEAINERIQPLEDKLDPFLEVLEGSRIISKGIAYIGGVLIGLGAIYTVSKQVFHL